MKPQNKRTAFTLLSLSCSFAFLLVATSCVSVKEYQKSRINDSEMELSNRKSEKFEGSFYFYREGPSGASGGKSSGGCGCN